MTKEIPLSQLTMGEMYRLAKNGGIIDGDKRVLIIPSEGETTNRHNEGTLQQAD